MTECQRSALIGMMDAILRCACADSAMQARAYDLKASLGAEGHDPLRGFKDTLNDIGDAFGTGW